MATYGFNEDDAKRIGRTVRLVERFPEKISLGMMGAEGAAPGVRLLIGQLAASSWPTATTANITIHNGEVGSVATALTLVAYNHYVKFPANSACSNYWVALGHNGFQWQPIEFASDCATSTCVIQLTDVNLSTLPGYAATSTQMLGHAGGCIKWFDIATCATAAT